MSDLYDQMWDYHDFFAFVDYQNFRIRPEKMGLNYDDIINLYMPFIDPTGPYLFYPPHCNPQKEDQKRSPIIAYIKNDNQIERDLIATLESLFSFQRRVFTILSFFESQNSFFEFYLYGQGISFNMATEKTQIGVGQGFFGNFYKFKNIGNFQFMEFESKEAIDEYIEQVDYGVSEDKP